MLRNPLTLFAAETSGPAIHIEPGKLFELGGFTITNSMFYAWISSSLIIVLMVIAARKIKIDTSKGPLQFVEIGTDFILNLVHGAIGNREKAVKYAPYFTTMFFFICLSNWLGLIPGVGEAITINGTPALRPFTADLNGTLAIAVVSMFFIQYFAIRESGIVKHLGHYFNGSLKNPMTVFFGLFEIFTEFTRVASLALRLFLNVVIGETIIAVFTYLGSAAAPLTSLPFVILELAVGALQAYIFVMLSVTYLAVAIKHGDEHEETDLSGELAESH